MSTRLLLGSSTQHTCCSVPWHSVDTQTVPGPYFCSLPHPAKGLRQCWLFSLFFSIFNINIIESLNNNKQFNFLFSVDFDKLHNFIFWLSQLNVIPRFQEQTWGHLHVILSEFLKEKFENLFIWLHQVLVAACGIFSYGMWDIVPWPGIEPRPLALGTWSLSHWTTKEVLFVSEYIIIIAPNFYQALTVEQALF